MFYCRFSAKKGCTNAFEFDSVYINIQLFVFNVYNAN